MVKVTKRDGRTEDFLVEKVVVSASKSGAPKDITREIGTTMESKVSEGTPTKEIKKMVLESLHEKNPEWKTNWLTYDRAVKKREE